MHLYVQSCTVYNSKTWKQPKVLLTNEWIKKMCVYTHMHAHTYTLWNTASSKKKKTQNNVICSNLNAT